MYNEDSYDETVNPAFDLYREFRAEDERKFREALGENESDNFDDQASEAGADSSGGAVISLKQHEAIPHSFVLFLFCPSKGACYGIT